MTMVAPTSSVRSLYHEWIEFREVGLRARDLRQRPFRRIGQRLDPMRIPLPGGDGRAQSAWATPLGHTVTYAPEETVPVRTIVAVFAHRLVSTDG